MPPPSGRDMRNMPLSFVQYMWDMNMGISFMVGREAARRIVPKDDADAKIPCGTLIFTVICGVCVRAWWWCVCVRRGEAGGAEHTACRRSSHYS